MLNERLPGGVHYGLKLKVVKSKIYRKAQNVVYLRDTYYAFDKHLINLDALMLNKDYYFLMVLYNCQWWIYDYILIQ